MSSTTTTGGARQSAAQAELSRRSQTPAQRIQHLLHGNPWLSPLVLLVVTIIVFSIVNPRFMQANSISLLVQQTAVVAALALGQTLVILTAGIDLSCGAICVLSMMIMASLAAKNGVPGPLALIIGVAFGLLAGYINGILVTRLNLPPFIVTLGTLSIFTAIALLYSGAESIQDSRLPDILNWTGNSFSIAGFRITNGVLLVIVMYAVVGFALSQTAWGRHLYAVGDDAESARLSGIASKRVLVSVYSVAGLLFGLAGWVLIGRSGGATPNAIPTGNLDSITAVVIGGTSLFGGRGGVVGTAIGALDRLRVHLRAVPRGGGPAVPDPRRRRTRHRRRGDRPVDQEGEVVTVQDASQTATSGSPKSADGRTPVLQGKGLIKTFGRVIGLDGVDIELYPGEVLAVIGDNGAGKSTLIKCLSGAYTLDGGELDIDGHQVNFRNVQDARDVGIETVYQQLAVIPALDIASNLYLAREERRPGPLGSVLRMLDKKGMRDRASDAVQKLGIQTIQNMGQAVETLSGGQRQAVAVARAAAFGSKVVILDEPTAALGVKEGNAVLDMIKGLRDKGMPVILISHNMPHVWEVADRIHIQRLARRAGVITPQSHTMQEGVAIMTGAVTLDGQSTKEAS